MELLLGFIIPQLPTHSVKKWEQLDSGKKHCLLWLGLKNQNKFEGFYYAIFGGQVYQENKLIKDKTLCKNI